MTLHDWIRTQDTQDTVELRNRANTHGPKTGKHTVTETIYRDTGLVARELQLLGLLQSVGISPSGATPDSVMATMDAKITAAETDLAKIELSVAAQKLMFVFNALTSQGGTITDPHFGQASYDQDRVIEEYAPSAAQEYGWGFVTGDMIERAIQG